MNDPKDLSRANRSKSRKSNNKILLFFVVLAVVFVIILLLLINFGNKEKPKQVDDSENNTGLVVQDEDQASNSEARDENESTNDDENNLDAANTAEDTENRLKDFKIDVPETDQSNDNIIEVYSGNWDPIGTTQTGEHITSYNDDSDDRVEIKMAVAAVTGIPEGDITEHFVGNGGSNETAISTISDSGNENFYKVYLSWINNQGWQVTKVEKVHKYIKK